MSDPFQRARQTAERLLKKYGQRMSLYEMESGGYNPMNPAQKEIGARRMCFASGCVLPTSESTVVIFDQVMRTDPLVTKNTRLVLLSGFNIEFPAEAGMLLKTGEGMYKITGNTPLDPQGTGGIIFRLKCTFDITLTPPIMVPGELVGEGEVTVP